MSVTVWYYFLLYNSDINGDILFFFASYYGLRVPAYYEGKILYHAGDVDHNKTLECLFSYKKTIDKYWYVQSSTVLFNNQECWFTIKIFLCILAEELIISLISRQMIKMFSRLGIVLSIIWIKDNHYSSFIFGLTWFEFWPK